MINDMRDASTSEAQDIRDSVIESVYLKINDTAIPRIVSLIITHMSYLRYNEQKGKNVKIGICYILNERPPPNHLHEHEMDQRSPTTDKPIHSHTM